MDVFLQLFIANEKRKVNEKRKANEKRLANETRKLFITLSQRGHESNGDTFYCIDQTTLTRFNNIILGYNFQDLTRNVYFLENESCLFPYLKSSPENIPFALLRIESFSQE